MHGARRGFTLIELLIVIVIIGILAAIAIPKFAEAREQAYVATMQSDLHAVAIAQEVYFTPERGYAEGVEGGGQQVPGLALTVSEGVTVTIEAERGPDGWAARAEHAGTEVACELFSAASAGDLLSDPIATEPGVVVCG